MRAALRNIYETLCDSIRYMRSTPIGGAKQHGIIHLQGDIIRMYHIIEKGLAMPEFRPRFGEDIIAELIKRVDTWKSLTKDFENIHFCAACEALKNYYWRHTQLNIDVSDLLPSEYLKLPQDKSVSGVRSVVGVDDTWFEGFKKVVTSRSSVRDFDTSRPPERELIRSAVDLSIRTPSVCNRQTWRVHFYEGEMSQSILKLQNGNRGFGHTIPTVLIVTCDMRYFIGSIERNQPWVDGGMFSMSLLLALHSHGLGAVSLNWAVLNSDDKKMRKTANIPDFERIIMLVGCGYPRIPSLTPVSVRDSVDSFINWHD